MTARIAWRSLGGADTSAVAAAAAAAFAASSAAAAAEGEAALAPERLMPAAQVPVSFSSLAAAVPSSNPAIAAVAAAHNISARPSPLVPLGTLLHGEKGY